MSESKRYILDKENGFHVMVNLYIIRYLYSHLDKAPRFMEQGSKRRKSIDFYEEVIHITRQRFGRILDGENFALDFGERNHISKQFDISENYFLRNGLLMEVHCLTETDWKCFFYERYGVPYKMEVPKKVIHENAEKIEVEMKRLAKKGVIENEYDTGTALFHVAYYFKHGVVYKEETRLTRFMKALSNLQMKDWEEIEGDLETLKQYSGLMKKHTEYVDVVVRYKELKNR